MFMFYLLMQEPESAFSVNLEFCKYILANFLNGKAIFDGVRKHKTIDANGDEKEQLVFVTAVKKDGKYFYIPVSKIIEYMQQKYNQGIPFSEKGELKESVGRLLNDMYSQYGKRILGIDGFCAYMGSVLEDLPLLDDKFIKQQDSDIYKFCLNSYDFDKEYEKYEISFNATEYGIDDYPIDIDEQEKVLSSITDVDKYVTHSSTSDANKNANTIYYKTRNNKFINIYRKRYSQNPLSRNVVSNIVNKHARWIRNSDEKYCGGCNFVDERCPYSMNQKKFLNISFEICNNQIRDVDNHNGKYDIRKDSNNDEITFSLNEVKKAVDSLCVWKREQCQCKDKDALKQQVWQILRNYIKQGYTTMKEVYDANTEIILQNPNTNKCKGICLGDYGLICGECQNRTPFHICCGVKYDFEENKYTYYKDGKPVEVTDEKRIKEIKKIADGTDNNENNIVLENTKNAGVGFCDKYFSWCCCCNGNDEKELANLQDGGIDINVNHYQY